MRYDIALIDVDDTLLDFAAAEYEALRGAFAQCGVPFDDSAARRYHEINDALWKRLEKGEIDRQGLWRERFAQLFCELGKQAPPDINEKYMAVLGQQAFPMAGAQRMLQSAVKMARLFIVTNGVRPVQQLRLEKAGLSGFFEGVFASQELGAQKPSAEFFERAFAKIGPFDRKRAVLLGDSLTSDMKGARTAGVAACWYCPDSQKPDTDGAYDYRISRLEQFISVLRGDELEPRA